MLSAFLLVNEGAGGGDSVGQLGKEQTFSNNGCHFIYSFNSYLLSSYHGPRVRDYSSEDISSNEDRHKGCPLGAGHVPDSLQILSNPHHNTAI